MKARLKIYQQKQDFLLEIHKRTLDVWALPGKLKYSIRLLGAVAKHLG